jgi:RNA polymerase sigma-70 factor, ECF subfamily
LASPLPYGRLKVWGSMNKRIIQLYVDRFNRRDWDGVRELISADARLHVFERFAGRAAGAPYIVNYERWP